MRTRILLADDHAIVREGLQSLLAAQPDVEVVAAVGDGQAAVDAAARLRPDVVVMDVTMPKLNGLDATRRILERSPDTKVVCLSMHAGGRMVEAMLAAGARAYVVKDSAAKELIAAIRQVLAGEIYLSPSVGFAGQSAAMLKAGVLSESFGVVSQREREVLQLFAEGLSTRDVADRLFLSVNTVQTHRRHLLEKLGLSTTGELVKYALREGLIKP